MGLFMQELEIKQNQVKLFDGIVGQSRIMEDVYWKIRLAAENDITVLITGESGTGKELVARSIHSRSQRSSGPFIAVNSGSMVKDLVPSELFGHEKGAFTGATELQGGVFENANDGTLFLDEVSSMDYKAQTSILRILENREFRRVGGKKILKTNARIIAATNKNLRKAIEEGKFRKDLFYRFEVFTINVPPLRKRWADIPSLVKEFINTFNIEMSKKIKKVSKEAMDLLMKYEWPGNVRELKNVIQRAMLLEKGNVLHLEHLPERLHTVDPKKKFLNLEIGVPLFEIEKQYIERTLWLLGGNKVKAAETLKISRRALYNKIEKYNL